MAGDEITGKFTSDACEYVPIIMVNRITADASLFKEFISVSREFILLSNDYMGLRATEGNIGDLM